MTTLICFALAAAMLGVALTVATFGAPDAAAAAAAPLRLTVDDAVESLGVGIALVAWRSVVADLPRFW